MSNEHAKAGSGAQSGPGPIPAPENFPVTWSHPADPEMFWLVERMHWPDPLPAMDFEFMKAAHEEFNWAFDSYKVPLQYHVRLLNHYWYYAVTPSIEDMSEMPARMGEGLGNIEETVARLNAIWLNEWLPEVKQHLAYFEEFDLPGSTTAALLEHLDEAVSRFRRIWQIHFVQTLPVYMAMSMFDDLYQDIFGRENALDSFRLLQGFNNETVQLGRALWTLSRRALESPAVAETLAQTTTAEVIPALEASEEGRAFLEEFRGFLEEYGQRGEKMGVSFPSWLEDPTSAIERLGDYVQQPDLDFDAEVEELATQRERHIEQARSHLAAYPQPVIDQFNAMLQAAQHGAVISEDHAYWIDFKSVYVVRQVLLEFGRRFVSAGALDDVADVFYLTLDEVRSTAAQLPDSRQQTTVEGRKAELEHFSAISPPPALGTPPSEPPPDDPLSRAVFKFFGAPPPEPQGTPEALIIRGGAGSSGTVTGRARIIRSLSDAHRLQAGDVLVAPTTAPAWTPLFATAGAVVTDTGGVLSHCAVVAREYGIPAVVGTGGATMMIADGQIVSVDGDRGTVSVIE